LLPDIQQPARQITALKLNLSGSALNGHFQNHVHCAHGRECPQPTAPFASGFRNTRSVHQSSSIVLRPRFTRG